MIVSYSPTPGRQFSAILCRYYSIQLLPWLIPFFKSIILHTCQHYRARIASSWSPYKCISALYWYYYYYGLVYIIDIYIYITYFLFVKCLIQNDTGWLLVIVLHQVDRLVRYRADINQYSYYRDHFRLLISYIAYLPTLRGEHCVFVITIQTYKCAISILWLIWFGISRQYSYA